MSRTGAGALVNPDHIVAYWIAVGILTAASLAPLVASVDGLLHVASWYMPPIWQWTLPFAFDGLMIGSAFAALILRRRHARPEAWAATGLTLLLVLASAVANWLQVYVSVDSSTLEGQAAPWIKAAMPLLTFIGFEIIAAVTSTRKQGENAPLLLARREIKKLRAELKSANRKASRQRGIAPAPQPAQLEGIAA